jgi:hypothetical protein
MTAQDTTTNTEEPEHGGGTPVDDDDVEIIDQDGTTTTGPPITDEDPETDLTILVGREMRWFFDRSTGKWYAAYGLPNSDREILLEATEEDMDALFGELRRPVEFERKRLQNILRDGNITFAGHIAEMEGEGSFEAEVARVKALALDAGLLPAWAEATGEYMDILFIAQSEGKSQEWVLDQFSRTESFQLRFPGIETFQNNANLTLVDSVRGFLEFEATLQNAVQGIGRNARRVTPDVVGGLLTQGHSINTAVDAVQKFDRMKNFRPALQAFNRILAEQGMEPIKTLQQMFDFVSGNAESDVYEVWEASSVSEAAAAAGLGDVFTAEDAIRFATQTEGQTSLEGATNAFQSAAQFLLQLRHEVEIGKFGLTTDDIIDMSIGQPLRSGTAAAEVMENMNRAISSAQASLRARSKPFTGFNQQGVAQRASLSGLRDEA